MFIKSRCKLHKNNMSWFFSYLILFFMFAKKDNGKSVFKPFLLSFLITVFDRCAVDVPRDRAVPPKFGIGLPKKEV